MLPILGAALCPEDLVNHHNWLRKNLVTLNFKGSTG